ncbi:MAG: tetratricopeptide repeat protein [Tepidisphaeraceae bacterium]
MKAERRHELKTNTLALGLEHFPELMRRYGGKVLLALVAIVLVFMLVRYRISSARLAARDAALSLSSAQVALGQIRSLGPQIPQDALARMRDQAADDAGRALDRVFELSDDPSVLAEAMITRGDLNWQMANFPQLPAATTQESLRPAKSPSEYLSQAEQAYQEVLSRYPGQSRAITSARFGLAAVAENRGEWETARRQYQEITNNAATIPAFKQLADARLANLGDLQQPVVIAKPSTLPATLPTPFVPTTQPQTTATTAPATPATTVPVQ